MQKITNKASILIWSSFLSLIILLIFTSISSKINKNLKNNSSFNKQLNIQNEINNAIKSGNFTSDTLSNQDELIFEDNQSHTGSLKTNETEEIKFGSTSLSTITIINGGPIHYTTGTSSGIINTNNDINVDEGSLYITNLGGYTKYNINSLNNFTTKTKKYKIIKTIGNKEVIVTSNEIKNF